MKLKKLISTHYKPSVLFEDCEAYKLEYSGRGKPKKTVLKGDGDFRSPECIELLKEADIVCTNPPFSLFREYVAQLMEYKKKFLIVGNTGVVVYKETFPLVQKNKLWFGTLKNVGLYFRVPDDYEFKNDRSFIDEKGHKHIRVKNVRWITNLSHAGRNKDIPLYKRYSKKEYPKYDNYNAIEVGKVNEIPLDYDGEMGVPITFFDKYNPKQFVVIGADWQLPKTKAIDNKTDMFYLNGNRLYSRIIIKHKRKIK